MKTKNQIPYTEMRYKGYRFHCTVEDGVPRVERVGRAVDLFDDPVRNEMAEILLDSGEFENPEEIPPEMLDEMMEIVEVFDEEDYHCDPEQGDSFLSFLESV